MKAVLLAATLVLGRLPAGQRAPGPTGGAAQHATCADCPGRTLTVDPAEWQSYVALRFLDKQHFLVAPGPLASRTNGDYALMRQLRFGELYFVLGSNNEVGRSARVVQCVRGRDTMTIILHPRNQRNVLYDSIAFRAGRYTLTESRTFPAAEASFTRYFTRHAARLARANPFSGCRFLPRPPHPVAPIGGYVPATPSDIFRLLVGHTTYGRVRYTVQRVVEKDSAAGLTH